MDQQTGVRVVRNDAAEQYEAYDGDTLAGLLAYIPGPGRVELVHTEVKPAFRGRGIGEQLADAALRAARAAGETVVPSCPFVNRYMREHSEFEELRAS